MCLFWESFSSYAVLSIFSHIALDNDTANGTKELIKTCFEEPKNYLGQEPCRKSHKGKKWRNGTHCS